MATNKVNGEMVVRNLIESTHPNPVTRHQLLHVFAEGIQEVNRYGRSNWLVSCDHTIRLVVGHYIICEADHENVWLTLDKEAVESPWYAITKDQLKGMGWNQDDPVNTYAFPVYKDRSHREFSINGIYKLSCFDDSWVHIRHLYFSFIYKAVQYGQRMTSSQPASHSPAVLMYIRNELGVHVPDPQF